MDLICTGICDGIVTNLWITSFLTRESTVLLNNVFGVSVTPKQN